MRQRTSERNDIATLCSRQTLVTCLRCHCYTDSQAPQQKPNALTASILQHSAAVNTSKPTTSNHQT